MSIFGESLYSCAVAHHTRTLADMRERAEKDRFQAEEALEKLISSVELIRDSGIFFFYTCAPVLAFETTGGRVI